MAAKKGGFILRGEVRRVVCPVCNAQPGKLCNTFDKREHPERTTLAIESQPEKPADAPTQSVEDLSKPAAVLKEAIDKAVVARALEAVCPPVTEAADDHPALDFPTRSVTRESYVPLGLTVHVDIMHGPTKCNWHGRLEEWDARHRTLNLLNDQGHLLTLQWGENDIVVLTEDQ